MVLLQIDPGDVETSNAEKATKDVRIDRMKKEYIYPTEVLGQKEGLNEDTEYKSNPKDVMKLSGYLFLTKQLGRK